MSQVEIKEITAESLCQLGVVEELVKQGRTPLFRRVNADYFKVHIHIPPEDIEVGDTARGEERGWVSTLAVDEALGELLSARVQAAVKELELSGQLPK